MRRAKRPEQPKWHKAGAARRAKAARKARAGERTRGGLQSAVGWRIWACDRQRRIAGSHGQVSMLQARRRTCMMDRWDRRHHPREDANPMPRERGPGQDGLQASSPRVVLARAETRHRVGTCEMPRHLKICATLLARANYSTSAGRPDVVTSGSYCMNTECLQSRLAGKTLGTLRQSGHTHRAALTADGGGDGRCFVWCDLASWRALFIRVCLHFYAGHCRRGRCSRHVPDYSSSSALSPWWAGRTSWRDAVVDEGAIACAHCDDCLPLLGEGLRDLGVPTVDGGPTLGVWELRGQVSGAAVESLPHQVCIRRPAVYPMPCSFPDPALRMRLVDYSLGSYSPCLPYEPNSALHLVGTKRLHLRERERDREIEQHNGATGRALQTVRGPRMRQRHGYHWVAMDGPAMWPESTRAIQTGGVASWRDAWWRHIARGVLHTDADPRRRRLICGHHGLGRRRWDEAIQRHGDDEMGHEAPWHLHAHYRDIWRSHEKIVAHILR